MLPMNMPERKAARRREAEQRQEKYNKLSLTEKLKQIQSRPGKSLREINRLIQKNIGAAYAADTIARMVMKEKNPRNKRSKTKN